MQAFSAAGQEMYQSQASEAEAASDEEGEESETGGEEAEGGDEGEAEASSDDDVVEADYEIVDEES
jgi:hypothetical protein